MALYGVVADIHGNREALTAVLEELDRRDRNLISFVNPGSMDASRKRGHKLAECEVLDTLDWRIDVTKAKAAVLGYRITP